MQKSIYDLFTEQEKEQVCDIVSKTISRTYKINKPTDLDFDVVWEQDLWHKKEIL